MDEVTARVARGVQDALLSGAVTDKDGVQRLKKRLLRDHRSATTPTDADIARHLDPAVARRFGHLLRKKPMRSQSGVAVVAVMSSPAACPHGKCIYCPGGPEADAPQSYTGFEPSTMRAKRHGYDPYRIVRSRLAGLDGNGHAIDKVELIVQGGTFPARDDAYQDWFVAGLYAGCNDGPGDGGAAWEPLDDWERMDPGMRTKRLVDLQGANETTRCRVVGLTIETKPDWCKQEHVDRMLRHGATRIELGIQCLDEETTRHTNRGHTVQDGADAMRVARDAGFKLCVHMMPGLPRIATEGGGWATDPAADADDLRRLFKEPDWRPDMLKVYPTLVVEEGETTLKRWWREGRFQAMDTAGAVEVLAESLRFVPEWCRIQRIDRDIPTTHVLAGVMNSNLRELAEAESARRGHPVRDIRAREVGMRLRAGAVVDPGRLVVVRREYQAGGGTEVFLSLEDPQADALVGFLRLRRVSEAAHRPEFRVEGGAAVVRELKVYGSALGLGEHSDEAWQHRGFGARLLREAEAVAFGEWGVGRLLVIAGVGVKAYYRRSGYEDAGPFVAREGNGNDPAEPAVGLRPSTAAGER